MAVIDSLKAQNYAQNNKFSVYINDGNTAMPVIPDSLKQTYQSLIVNIQLPDLVNDLVEEYVGTEWVNATARESNAREITIQFRDVTGMDLYRHFKNFIRDTKTMFPEEFRFSVNVNTRDRSGTEIPLINFEQCYIDSVSGLTLDNGSSNQLTEYTIRIKSTFYNVP